MPKIAFYNDHIIYCSRLYRYLITKPASNGWKYAWIRLSDNWQALYLLALKKSVPLVKYLFMSQISVPFYKHPSRGWGDFPEEVTGQSILESDKRETALHPTLSFDRDDDGGWGRKVPHPQWQHGGVSVNHVSRPPSSQALLCTMCPSPLSQAAFPR